MTAMARALVALCASLASSTCALAVPVVQADVVVVGAGWSGLSAAWTILNEAPHLQVHVLEADDHVGGRTLNVDVRTGARSSASDDIVELGGEWISPAHTSALTLLKELGGFELYHRPNKAHRRWTRALGTGGKVDSEGLAGLKLVVMANEVRQTCDHPACVVRILSPAARRAVKNATDEYERLAKTISCSNPLLAPEARQLDSTTMAQWVHQFTGNLSKHEVAQVSALLEPLADDAEDLAQISLFGAIWQYSCSGDVEGNETEDYFRIRGGTQAPPLLMASKLEAIGALTLQSPVTQVRRNSKLALHRFTVTSDRVIVEANHVVLTGSPSAQLGIRHVPPLPGDLAQLFQRIPLGASLKYTVVYEKPWWREGGLLGEMIALPPPLDSPHKVLPSRCLDNSPYSWSRGVIACFIEGRRNRIFEYGLGLDRKGRRDLVLEFLSYGLNDTRAKTHALETYEEQWSDNQWVGGAYGTYYPPGVLTGGFFEVVQRLAEPVDGLYFAGTDYTFVSPGYIDGAIYTGRAAARRIIQEAAEAEAEVIKELFA